MSWSARTRRWQSRDSINTRTKKSEFSFLMGKLITR